MTLEEKLTYMQTVSMEQARAEGNAIIDAHREALEKIFSDHKSEMMRQAETRIKAETTNAKRTVSQALAKSQLEIKRSQGKVQQELKDKVFEEAMQLVNDYMKTKAYDDFLVKCIRKAERFAGDDPVVIYINPSDEKKRTELEKETISLSDLYHTAHTFPGIIPTNQWSPYSLVPVFPHTSSPVTCADIPVPSVTTSRSIRFII